MAVATDVLPYGRCWLWAGASTNGYGVASVGGRRPKGRQVRIHRAAYEALVGPIPDGMHVDHLCRVRNCYNPAHLEAVTQAENNQRSNALRTYERKTHCAAGHPFPDVPLASGIQQKCRECGRLKAARYRQRRRG